MVSPRANITFRPPLYDRSQDSYDRSQDSYGQQRVDEFEALSESGPHWGGRGNGGGTGFQDGGGRMMVVKWNWGIRQQGMTLARQESNATETHVYKGPLLEHGKFL